jgi:hypothetical protein
MQMQTKWSMKKASQCNIPVKLKYQKCVYIKNDFHVIPIKLYMPHNTGLHKITTDIKKLCYVEVTHESMASIVKILLSAGLVSLLESDWR